jgi:hypothetical protein
VAILTEEEFDILAKSVGWRVKNPGGENPPDFIAAA